MDSFIENLKQQVQCFLCKDTLSEPTILQCFHTFCKTCLMKHAQLKDQVNIFQCPTCNSETTLPEINEEECLELSELHLRMLTVLNFAESEKVCSVSASHSPVLCYCFDCDQSLCDECLKCHTAFVKNHRIISMSDLKKEDLEEMFMREPQCSTHRNNTVELYCKDCEVLVCCFCIKDDHKNHKIMTTQEFKVDRKALLSKDLEDIERLQSKENEKQQQQEIATKVKRSGEKAITEVKKKTKQLVKHLLDQEDKLINEIQRSITRAVMNLRIIHHSPGAQQHIRNLIDKGTASDMIDSCQNKEGCTKFTYSSFKKEISGVFFEPDVLNVHVIQNATLGNVRFTELSSQIMSKIKVDNNIMALEKAKLILVTKKLSKELNYDDTDEVDIHFTPEDDVKLVDGMTKTDGKVQVEFIPKVPSPLSVAVKLNGLPVSNSPLVMDVKPQLIKEAENSKFKMALNKKNERNKYMGIAVNRDNSRIALGDHSMPCIKVFTLNGELLLTFGGEGSQDGQLKTPQGLAFLNDEDLVIVDNGNSRLCIVNTTTGTLIKTFGCHGKGNGEFSNPNGVYVDHNELNIIVSDTGNNRVQVFTKDGDYKYSISFSIDKLFCVDSTIKHNGLFYSSIHGIAVIYVIEMKDNTPTVVSTIGGEGTDDGQLQQPYGIAIDNDQNLLVCDDGCVRKFTLDGRYIGKTRQFGSSNIYYIAVSNDGQVICTKFDKEIFCF